MSLLSRLRESKGYGACRDAAMRFDLEGTLALIARGFGPVWSARGASVALARGSFSTAHVAGKTIELDSRHPSRELCEALKLTKSKHPCFDFERKTGETDAKPADEGLAFVRLRSGARPVRRHEKGTPFGRALIDAIVAITLRG